MCLYCSVPSFNNLDHDSNGNNCIWRLKNNRILINHTSFKGFTLKSGKVEVPYDIKIITLLPRAFSIRTDNSSSKRSNNLIKLRGVLFFILWSSSVTFWCRRTDSFSGWACSKMCYAVVHAVQCLLKRRPCNGRFFLSIKRRYIWLTTSS